MGAQLLRRLPRYAGSSLSPMTPTSIRPKAREAHRRPALAKHDAKQSYTDPQSPAATVSLKREGQTRVAGSEAASLSGEAALIATQPSFVDYNYSDNALRPSKELWISVPLAPTRKGVKVERRARTRTGHSRPLPIRKTWPSGWRTCISRTFQGMSVGGQVTSSPCARQCW
jgi:hypothetical protein